MKPDLQLKHDVAAELEFQPSVNAAAIGVEVSDGVVTLSGHVDSHAEKWYAETAAQRVEGVKGLVINLHVELPGPHKRSDADIVRAASEALKWNITIPKDAVQVIVEHGKVTLTGDLSWDYQRRAAEVAMRNLVGVTGVNNQIAVRPHVSTVEIQNKIEAALRRQAEATAHRIKITADGGTVILTGSVKNWAEHVAATRAAWAAPGVSKVVNKTSVSA